MVQSRAKPLCIAVVGLAIFLLGCSRTVYVQGEQAPPSLAKGAENDLEERLLDRAPEVAETWFLQAVAKCEALAADLASQNLPVGSPCDLEETVAAWRTNSQRVGEISVEVCLALERAFVRGTSQRSILTAEIETRVADRKTSDQWKAAQGNEDSRVADITEDSYYSYALGLMEFVVFEACPEHGGELASIEADIPWNFPELRN